jgi:hypothetical protein
MYKTLRSGISVFGVFLKSEKQNELEVSMLWENPGLTMVFRLLKDNKFIKFSIPSNIFESIEKKFVVNVSVNGERSYKLKMEQGIFAQDTHFDNLLTDKDIQPFAKPIEAVGTNTVGFVPSTPPDIETATDNCRKQCWDTGMKVGAALGAGAGVVVGGAAGGYGREQVGGPHGAVHGAIHGAQAGGIIVGTIGRILGGAIGSLMGSLSCPTPKVSSQ